MTDWKEIYRDLKKACVGFLGKCVSTKPHGPLPLTVVFVRHAQADTTDTSHLVGPPLTRLGNRQAILTAKRLSREKFAHIYTSDLVRAKETARAILRHHPKTPCTVLRDLREVASHHSSLGMSATTPAIDADTVNEKMAMSSFVHAIRRNHEPGERLLVVAHGNILRGLIPLLGGLNPTGSPLFEFNNTSVTVVDLWPSGHAVIKLVNCTKHLPRRLVT